MIAATHRKAWLDWLSIEKRYGDNTLSAYGSDLDDFCAFIRNSGTATLTNYAISRLEFRAWLADMAARSLARTTIARRVSSLRSFYRFCGQMGLADIKDMSWLKASRPPRAVPKSVSHDDALAMLSAVFNRRGPDWSKKRNFSLLMLLYGVGLRISEALSLKRGDAPLPDWLRITGKGGKIREVPVLPAVTQAIED